ncbi:hypothetical protein PHLGIDRAFT_32669 [Phlebiopsis gigantea 11061_1 CR5-6]|uniref:INO80 complex subunit F domain-containing protein n=1 Tax=Phlebiopsis gigantea (strain 11061_1 CR5-6) TaxID=745531 RepID=A0A0C3SEI4_PHLG1|nr:hypothetical protein PHLGIDRAFT_32669 [Phlebiopsis gigantea 11061_1 CR5-6]
MSRQPSPLPHNQQMYHQIPLAPSSSRQKTKSHVVGIAAGAEDVKYQAKYKELKKKVKEIELDNDRLYLKLLLAKKNIRRMNLERAILYERLAAVPPTPGRQTQELPAEHDPMFAQQPPGQPEPARLAPDDRLALDEYLRSNPNARVIEDHDGRVIAIEDGTGGRGSALGITGPPPPRGIPVVPAYRPEPATEYASERHLVSQVHDVPGDVQASNSSVAALHGSTSGHLSTTHRSRSSSSRHELDAYGAEPTRLDTFPPSQHVHSRSSSLSGEGQVDARSRRLEPLDTTAHPHQHSQVPAPNLPPSPQLGQSPTQGRLHNHQRIGPGVHLHRNKDRDPEETQRLLLEREKERERDREREVLLQERLLREEEELRSAMQHWVPPPEYGAGTSSTRSRADSPRSHSDSEDSAPGDAYRTVPAWAPREAYDREAHPAHGAPRYREPEGYYERDRDDRVPVSSARGAYPAEYRASEARKRSRHDMEVEVDRAVERDPPRAGGAADVYPISQELRGPRRGHSDEGDVSRLHTTSSIRDERPMDQDD